MNLSQGKSRRLAVRGLVALVAVVAVHVCVACQPAPAKHAFCAKAAPRRGCGIRTSSTSSTSAPPPQVRTW